MPKGKQAEGKQGRSARKEAGETDVAAIAEAGLEKMMQQVGADASLMVGEEEGMAIILEAVSAEGYVQKFPQAWCSKTGGAHEMKI